jgi:hypothetical protein
MKGLIAIALSFSVSYLVGLRGWLLLVAGFVLWFPATSLMVVILSLIVRPQLQPYSASGEESHFTSLSLNEPAGSGIPEDRQES